MFDFVITGGNQLEGTIPTELGKLAKLLMLNLGKSPGSEHHIYYECKTLILFLNGHHSIPVGRNTLHGGIPSELGRIITLDKNTDTSCDRLPLPFRKVKLNWLSNVLGNNSDTNKALQTLALCELFHVDIRPIPVYIPHILLIKHYSKSCLFHCYKL